MPFGRLPCQPKLKRDPNGRPVIYCETIMPMHVAR